jgi:hypothetical protein
VGRGARAERRDACPDRVRDPQAGNEGPPVRVTFTRSVGGVANSQGGAGLVRFPRLRLIGRGRVRTLRGGSLPGITSGVRIEWFLKRGRRWRRLHAIAKPARRPFLVRQRLLRAGRWRVRALYLGRGVVPRTASCWFVFRTSRRGSRLQCPRGTVRPSR